MVLSDGMVHFPEDQEKICGFKYNTIGSWLIKCTKIDARYEICTFKVSFSPAAIFPVTIKGQQQ